MSPFILFSLLALSQAFRVDIVSCSSKKSFTPNAETGNFTLHDLPYSYDFLEPVITVQINSIHHQKHHAKYVSKLDAYLATSTKYSSSNLVDLQEEAEEDTTLQKFAGGHYNHNLFWWIMTNPACARPPQGDLLGAIQAKWGSFGLFKTAFSTAASGLFGSGWTWLTVTEDKQLAIVTTPNQQNPLMGLAGDVSYPIVGLDVWEHAFYLKYLWDKDSYITAWFDLIDWEVVEYFYTVYARAGNAVPA
jgi:Fe-Mn family superoxide dismutase